MMRHWGWFRLATHLSMPLDECMEKHTHRQYTAWMLWLDEQWNVPSRGDHYAMQIAQEVRRVLCKDPNAIVLDDFKITFDDKEKEEKPKITKEQATEWAKAKWFGLTGLAKSTKSLIGKAIGKK